MFKTRTLQPMTDGEISAQEKLVSAAAREEVTEFDEMAASIGNDTVRTIRTHGDAVVLIKHRIVAGDESRQWIDNLAEAIVRRSDMLNRQRSDMLNGFTRQTCDETARMKGSPA